MACCGQSNRRQAAPGEAVLVVGGWAWRVLLPDGTIEDGYDEAGAMRRANDAGGTYEAVLPSTGVAIII